MNTLRPLVAACGCAGSNNRLGCLFNHGRALFVVLLAGLCGGCNMLPGVQFSKPATTYDVEKAEGRLSKDIQDWNARSAKQWEVISANKEQIGKNETRIATVETDVKNLGDIFWKVIAGAGVAGVGGGYLTGALKRAGHRGRR